MPRRSIGPEGTPRRRAPAVLVVSGLLLGLCGLAWFARAVAGVEARLVQLQARETVPPAEGFSYFILLFLLGIGLIGALAAFAILALALLNLAGWNWTRIVTWLIGGVMLVLVGADLALSLLPDSGGETPESVDWDRVAEVAGQLMPPWVDPVARISRLVASPALLALPSTNRFYGSRRTPALPYRGSWV